MYRVTILGYEQAYASAITGALELFALAGVTWQRMHGIPPEPKFHVEIATLAGLPVRCINNLTLQAHVAIEDVKKTDLLLIPTIGGRVEDVLQQQSTILPHILRLYHAGADVASNCSGAFFLAEAGLLDGLTATTHWGYADLFRRRFPLVRLQEDKMITQNDRLFCSGGGMAWFDLTLLLIERYCGHDVAAQTAKAHVIDPVRANQAAYGNIRSKKHHHDKDITVVQEWIEEHYSSSLSLEQLATLINTSPRTLIRRFKQATGTTPSRYVQMVRIEAAKKFLETTSLSTEQIINQVGYEDMSSFCRLFKNRIGLSPVQYRHNFRRSVINP
ncbi:GlxA family transcriptional regulator [Aestuariibacter salexigens]|uniref:GlxA family transcriptional regulator n=1 Tax=Aestuariibacter salexigens TaxID=226010 RepID=UPI0003F7E7F5|nr:AraC family transcriptional regulator [Aestuariibacter salexigens]